MGEEAKDPITHVTLDPFLGLEGDQNVPNILPPKGGHEYESPPEQEIPQSNEHPIPRWLLLTYAILPILGLVTLYFFWDGSNGWFDRGHWQALQKAAGTTPPYVP